VGAVKVILPLGVLQLLTLVTVDVGIVTVGLAMTLFTFAETQPVDISLATVA
jgi:hypothetical protein